MTSAPHRGASGCSVLTYIITKVPAVSQRCDTRTGGRPSQEMKRRRTCVRPRFPRRGLFLGYVEILPNGTTWIHFRAGSKTVALIQWSSTLMWPVTYLTNSKPELSHRQLFQILWFSSLVDSNFFRLLFRWNLVWTTGLTYVCWVITSGWRSCLSLLQSQSVGVNISVTGEVLVMDRVFLLTSR